MKAYQGRKKYAGELSENLKKNLKINETISAMCELIDDQKLKGQPVMLLRYAIDQYAENSHTCKNFHQENSLLIGWYNNADKASRI